MNKDFLQSFFKDEVADCSPLNFYHIISDALNEYIGSMNATDRFQFQVDLIKYIKESTKKYKGRAFDGIPLLIEPEQQYVINSKIHERILSNIVVEPEDSSAAIENKIDFDYFESNDSNSFDEINDIDMSDFGSIDDSFFDQDDDIAENEIGVGNGDEDDQQSNLDKPIEDMGESVELENETSSEDEIMLDTLSIHNDDSLVIVDDEDVIDLSDQQIEELATAISIEATKSEYESLPDETQMKENEVAGGNMTLENGTIENLESISDDLDPKNQISIVEDFDDDDFADSIMVEKTHIEKDKK